MSAPATGKSAGPSPARSEEPHGAALRAGFRRALEACPEELVERTYTLASRPVRVRCVGRELAEALTPALSHLEREPGDKPALEIEVWDESVTGVACPAEARPRKDCTSWPVGLGTFWSIEGGREVGYARRHSLMWLDRKQEVVSGWVKQTAMLSLFERGKPFFYLLSVWHDDRGARVVHAGMVGRNGKGVLIPGMGGAGKSTTSLLCLRHEMEYLGDDYIGLERRRDGAFIGHSLFSSTWLEPEHGRQRFPDLMSEALAGDGPDEDKDLVLLADRYRALLPPRAEIAALALPRIVDRRRTIVRPAGKGEALLVAAPSSMLCLIPRPHPDAWHQLTALVETVACYWLELGRDTGQIPLRLSDLLQEVTG